MRPDDPPRVRQGRGGPANVGPTVAAATEVYGRRTRVRSSVTRDLLPKGVGLRQTAETRSHTSHARLRRRDVREGTVEDPSRRASTRPQVPSGLTQGRLVGAAGTQSQARSPRGRRRAAVSTRGPRPIAPALRGASRRFMKRAGQPNRSEAGLRHTGFGGPFDLYSRLRLGTNLSLTRL